MKTTEIVFENEEILVINKAAGVSVQGGAGIAHPLDEELSKQLGYKIHLVHRLDKETSGLMVVAKNSAAAAKWIALIAGKLVKKEYRAVCFGKPVVNGKEAVKGTLRDSVQKAGRELSAVTDFEVIKSAEVKCELPVLPENQQNGPGEFKSTVSLLHLTLGTGRMHQIRIHLAKAGCPIVQDDRHGNFKLNKQARKLGAKTLCLASTRLTIPEGKGSRTFEIELPDHMKKMLELINLQ